MIPDNEDTNEFWFYEIYCFGYERRGGSSIPGKMYVLGTCLEDAQDNFNYYVNERTKSMWRGEVVVIHSIVRHGDFEVMHTLGDFEEDNHD